MPAHTLSPHQPWAPPVVQVVRSSVPAAAIPTTTVWLPTQGAKRAFRQAWAASGGGLLPRLVTPHGNLEELHALGLPPTLWPTASETAAVLTQLYHALQKAEEGLPPSAATRWQQAQGILDLLTELALANQPASSLWHSVPTHLAQHWQQNASVLQAVVGAYQTAVQQGQVADVASIPARRWQALTAAVQTGHHLLVGLTLQRVAEHTFLAAATANPHAHLFTLSDASTPNPASTYEVVAAPHMASEALAIVAATKSALAQNQTPVVLAVGEPALAILVTHHLRAAGLAPRGFLPHPLAQTPLGGLLQAIATFATGGVLQGRNLAHLAGLLALQHPNHHAAYGLLEQHVFRGTPPRNGRAGGWLAKLRRLNPQKFVQNEVDAAATVFEGWQASPLFQPPARATLGGWCDWVHAVLGALWEGWRTDPHATTWQTSCKAWHHANAPALDGPAFAAWLSRTLQEWPTEDSASTDPAAPILTGRLAGFSGAQTLIVAGLAETHWLPTSPHPWLSEGQRRTLNLPTNTTARQLAESELAHLLASGGAQRVILTRSLQDGDTELAPTPLLQAFLNGHPASQTWQQAGSVHLPASTATPVPAAPTALPWPTPASWSPSLVEALLACPFKAALTRLAGQEEWHPFDMLPDARDFGNILHNAAQLFWQQYPTPVVMAEDAPAATATLQGIALKELDRTAPDQTPLWAPRIRTLCIALVNQWVHSGAQGWQNTGTEETLTATLGPIALKGRADQLDTRPDGTYQLLDYKTGTPPNPSQLKSGEKPQLPLLAWLLTHSGRTVSHAAFWHLVGYNARTIEETTLPDLPTHIERVAVSLPAVLSPYVTAGQDATFPATPGLAKAGIMPDGPCKTCPAAGWCRYPAWAHHVKREASA